MFIRSSFGTGRFSLLFGLVFFHATSGFAWDHHPLLYSHLLRTRAAGVRNYLLATLVVPSKDEQLRVLEEISQTLAVNLEKIPIQKSGTITVKELMLGNSSDEPDLGMDQDLPDSADPSNDRKWMGGKTGPTSQGFRHMIFPGIEWSSPLRTLQIPTRTIGQAPGQILKLHELSQKFFSQKNPYWGLRILLWELHFIQDLHQPFHVTQVPYFKMLPWKELFKRFVPRSTQVMANFHYAYEGLIREALEADLLSPLSPCFETDSGASLPPLSRAGIENLIRQTRDSAEKIGVPLHALWDREMKDPVVVLPEGIGSVDYFSYLNANPEEENQKKVVQNVDQILKTTCGLMKNISRITFSELDRAFDFQ